MVSTTRSTMPQALTFEMDEDALAFDPGRVIPIDYSQRVEPPIFFLHLVGRRSVSRHHNGDPNTCAEVVYSSPLALKSRIINSASVQIDAL